MVIKLDMITEKTYKIIVMCPAVATPIIHYGINFFHIHSHPVRSDGHNNTKSRKRKPVT